MSAIFSSKTRKGVHWSALLPFFQAIHIFIFVTFEYRKHIIATTSLSLGEHWEVFIRNEVSSGRYGSASEVVRDALRAMEERKSKLEALHTHLAQGAEQASAGEFVDDFSMDKLINDLDSEA
tara:strand:+ start:578 stop:943 length:366 start_codon:yes stop_codon:yes gene_type:complete